MNVPAVRIRRASPDDAPTIAEIESLALASPWSADDLRATLAGETGAAWIAEADGAAIGFALFLRGGDELELLRLGVDPAWRRAGVGGELVARGLAAAIDDGLVACHLEVRADNRPARSLYERLGFALAGTRRRYYADGADACLYRRALPRSSG